MTTCQFNASSHLAAKSQVQLFTIQTTASIQSPNSHNMAPVQGNRGKRKANTLEYAANEADVINPNGSSGFDPRPAKATRIGSPVTDENVSSGQRFGEAVSFLPLSSQASVFEEDDAEAEDLIQGSQGYDTSADYIFYGAFTFHLYSWLLMSNY